MAVAKAAGGFQSQILRSEPHRFFTVGAIREDTQVFECRIGQIKAETRLTVLATDMLAHIFAVDSQLFLTPRAGDEIAFEVQFDDRFDDRQGDECRHHDLLGTEVGVEEMTASSATNDVRWNVFSTRRARATGPCGHKASFKSEIDGLRIASEKSSATLVHWRAVRMPNTTAGVECSKVIQLALFCRSRETEHFAEGLRVNGAIGDGQGRVGLLAEICGSQ